MKEVYEVRWLAFYDRQCITVGKHRATNLKSPLGVFETTKKRIFSFFGVLRDLNFLTVLWTSLMPATMLFFVSFPILLIYDNTMFRVAFRKRKKSANWQISFENICHCLPISANAVWGSTTRTRAVKPRNNARGVRGASEKFWKHWTKRRHLRATWCNIWHYCYALKVLSWKQLKNKTHNKTRLRSKRNLLTVACSCSSLVWKTWAP